MLDVASQGIEDGHVIRLLEKSLLQTLEDRDGVTEQNLRGYGREKSH